MVNKYLLGLKRYTMRTVSVCTSKSNRFGSVYKKTVQRYRLPAEIMKAWRSQNIRLCKTEATWLFIWFNFVVSPYAWFYVTYRQWEPSVGHQLRVDEDKRTISKMSITFSTKSMLKSWLSIRHMYRIETDMWLSYYKCYYRSCDSWKILFQSCQVVISWAAVIILACTWVQQGHVIFPKLYFSLLILFRTYAWYVYFVNLLLYVWWFNG